MSKSLAFLFPGQGAQYVGMGTDLCGKFHLAQETFNIADNALGFKISEICFNGPEEELKQTENTQPAILTHSIAVWNILKNQLGTPVVVAGHSLGEYSALVAAGVITFEEAVKAVRIRGELMRDAASGKDGGMATIIGIAAEDVVKICQEAAEHGIVQPANFNSPEQTVISGEKTALEIAIELAKTKGARRALMLPVSVALHSEVIRDAADGLAAHLENITFNKPEMPVIANVLAEPLDDPVQLKKCLIDQVSGSVRWVESMKCLGNQGVDKCYELGPGNVLKGLMKRIEPGIEVINIGNIDQIESI
jgi:[acyl-carrier-protein] S-malonyltransferase